MGESGSSDGNIGDTSANDAGVAVANAVEVVEVEEIDAEIEQIEITEENTPVKPAQPVQKEIEDAEIEQIEVEEDAALAQLQKEIAPTLQRIEEGGKYPHDNDRTTFKNRGEPLPPQSDSEYYTEYVHPTPNVDHAGEQRVVTGKNGEIYYTSDHYLTFTKVK